MELDGKVALVTGGTRGIGRGIAEIFLADGARVMINGKTAAKGERALAEIAAGDRCDFHAADVSNRDAAAALVDATVGRFGRLDIVVNNAGGSTGFGLVHELSDEAWDGTADWTLNSAFWVTRRALQTMGVSYEQFLDNYAQESMIKRLNTVEEVAAMAMLLASNAGGGITGALLNVDGGTSAW